MKHIITGWLLLLMSIVGWGGSAEASQKSQVSAETQSIVGKWRCKGKDINNEGTITEFRGTTIYKRDGTITSGGTVIFSYPETETHYSYEELFKASASGSYRVFNSTILIVADEYSITRWERAGANLLDDPEMRSVIRDTEASVRGVSVKETILSLTAEELVTDGEEGVSFCQRW